MNFDESSTTAITTSTSAKRTMNGRWPRPLLDTQTRTRSSLKFEPANATTSCDRCPLERLSDVPELVGFWLTVGRTLSLVRVEIFDFEDFSRVEIENFNVHALMGEAESPFVLETAIKLQANRLQMEEEDRAGEHTRTTHGQRRRTFLHAAR